jgi:predicted nucleic acid-binding protein
VLGRQLEPWQAERALIDLADLAVERHAHELYLWRVWELRSNVTAYDAVYVALAEALGATLLTCDGRLGRAPLTTVDVEVIEVPR